MRLGDEAVHRITSEDDLAQFGTVPSLDYQFGNPGARASSDSTPSGTEMVH